MVGGLLQGGKAEPLPTFFFFFERGVCICVCMYERQIFHLLGHSLSGHNDRGLARPKERAWNSIWVSYVGTGAQAFGLSSAVFVGAWEGSWEHLELEPAVIWNV